MAFAANSPAAAAAADAARMELPAATAPVAVACPPPPSPMPFAANASRLAPAPATPLVTSMAPPTAAPPSTIASLTTGVSAETPATAPAAVVTSRLVGAALVKVPSAAATPDCKPSVGARNGTTRMPSPKANDAEAACFTRCTAGALFRSANTCRGSTTSASCGRPLRTRCHALCQLTLLATPLGNASGAFGHRCAHRSLT